MTDPLIYSAAERRAAGDNCIAYRQRWRLTAEQMAKAMGCNVAAIDAIEDGIILPRRFNGLVGRILHRRKEAMPRIVQVRWDYDPILDGADHEIVIIKTAQGDD